MPTRDRRPARLRRTTYEKGALVPDHTASARGDRGRGHERRHGSEAARVPVAGAMVVPKRLMNLGETPAQFVQALAAVELGWFRNWFLFISFCLFPRDEKVSVCN